MQQPPNAYVCILAFLCAYNPTKVCVCVCVLRDFFFFLLCVHPPSSLTNWLRWSESRAWSVYLTALGGDSLWTRPLSLTDCCVMKTKDSRRNRLPRVKLTNGSGCSGECREILSGNTDSTQVTAVSTAVRQEGRESRR